MKNKGIFYLSIALLLTSCGGGTSTPAGNNTNIGIPQGKISVDGHILNPDFYNNGVSYVFISYFNDDGTLKSYHKLYDWNGSDPTYLLDVRYTYDSSAKLAATESEFTYTREGPALYTHTFNSTNYTYDSSGNLTLKELALTAADYNGDGIYTDDTLGLTKIFTYFYDTNSRLTSATVDAGADNIANASNDTTTSYQYNSSSQTSVKHEIDGAGGDKTTLYEYGINGKKSREIYYATAARYASDLKSSIKLFTYDVTDQLVKEETDYTTPGMGSINDTVDGITDTTKIYSYGSNGEILQESTENLYVTYSEKTIIRYVYEVRDTDANGIPESIFTYFTTSKITNNGGGYPADVLPTWYTKAQSSLNNGNSNDGWDLNWEGHNTGTCSTCGNMAGQINKLMLGI